MKKEVEDFLEDLIVKQNYEVPEFGFTVQDYIEKMQKMGVEVPDHGTIYRRLNRLANKGELIKVKVSSSLVYYCEIKYKHLVELDEEAIMEA